MSLSFMSYFSDYSRDIDNAYHLAQIAENAEQIKAYHQLTLQLQATTALASLQRQDVANAYLYSMAQELSTMSHLSSLINEELDRISQQILQQQRVLEEIAEVLRHPYETKALELRREAEKWLNNGMKKAPGRDRDEDWKDAMRLYRTTVQNPIGMQDYVAWFQFGWLLANHEQNFAEAEEAFYRSYRLSASNRDLYYVKSLKNLAALQYSQSKYEEAYQTIHKALTIDDIHDILYDAARYAAKTGREQECLALLDKCIDLQPTTIVTMFAEVDFQ